MPEIGEDAVEATSTAAPLSRAVRVAIPLAVFALTFLAFLPALEAGFVDLDDLSLLVQNDRFRGFGAEELRWMWTTRLWGHWQPLSWMSLAVDDAISGRDPSSYHRTNVVLHALDAVLVYCLALRLFALAHVRSLQRPWLARAGAAIAALAFGVHPLRVESVAWVTERRDVLSTFFLLAALIAYLRAFAPERAEVVSRGWYAASIALLALSLCAKAWGMTFVAVVLVLDVWPLRRLTLPGASAVPSASAALGAPWFERGWRDVLVQKMPFAVLGLAAGVVANWSQNYAAGQLETLARWNVGARIVQALYGLAFYVAKTLWPADLVAMVERPWRFDPFEPRFVASYAAVLALVIAAWVLRRRTPAFIAALAVYAIVVSPVIGFTQAGPQLVADRYSYLSCIGWAICAGAGWAIAWERSPRAWLRAALTVTAVSILAVLGVMTWRQSRVWHDSRSLWTHALAAGRPSAIAHHNYALLEAREGRVSEALMHLEHAVALNPDHGDSWHSFGKIYMKLERWADAERAWREAARCSQPASLGWMRLGRLYENQLGRLDDAIEAYRAAVADSETGPRVLFNPNTHLALGIALARRGDREEARTYLEIAARYAKTQAEARRHLAELH